MSLKLGKNVNGRLPLENGNFLALDQYSTHLQKNIRHGRGARKQNLRVFFQNSSFSREITQKGSSSNHHYYFTSHHGPLIHDFRSKQPCLNKVHLLFLTLTLESRGSLVALNSGLGSSRQCKIEQQKPVSICCLYSAKWQKNLHERKLIPRYFMESFLLLRRKHE